MKDHSSSKLARSHREKVLAHAAARLRWRESDTDLGEVATSLRMFLKIEDRRLRMSHEIGAPGRKTAAMRSFVLDIVVAHAFRHAARSIAPDGEPGNTQYGCALLAVGGYGRAELAPFSDLDLLLLYSGPRLSQIKPVSANLLRLLWDAGLTVGHSFRTVGDSVTTALDDPHLRTALVNTRLLAGNKGLHNSLQEALEKDRRRRIDSFLAAINREREARYAKFGAAICLQEPNIKETAGGLRDYHTALWLAHARHGYTTLDELRAHGLVAEDEARRVSRAYDFLWRIRHSAHFLMSRKTERLSLDLQPLLARQFGYEAGKYSLGSEKLMRDYYRHARELHFFSEALLARVTDSEPRSPRRWRKRSGEASREPFSIRNGRLHFDGEPDFLNQKPLAMFNAFALAQAARVPFGFRLREIMAHNMRAIGPGFRSCAESSNAFGKLLRRRGRAGYVLRLMHDVGFLGRLIPEFGRISLLVQHDLYHHFTVDEHTLKAAEILDDLHVTADKQRAPFRAVFDEIKNPGLLYLAVLLHDVGKGQGRGHIARGAKLAEKVCTRLGLKEADTKTVVLLVNQHVSMAHLAQRRDLNEPCLIAEFAGQLDSLEELNMLLLMTYADLSAVGPGVWTEWKGNLLWDLYRRARKLMTGLDVPLEGGAELVRYKEQIAAALAPPVPLSEVERHLALLPDRYQRITSPEAAAMHLRMIETVRTGSVAFCWGRQTTSLTRLTVCAPDRHGLFADLAGAVAACGIEILSAELNTREDGIAIDEFILRQASTRRAVEDHRYEKLEQTLSRAAAGELEIAALIEHWRTRNAPRKRATLVPARRRNLPRVVCDNEASAASTMVEVHAVDEPGLAHKIASALAGLGLEIICARIATEKSDALDVFYVTDADGMKLSYEATTLAEAAIKTSLGKLEVAPAISGSLAGRETNEKSRGDYQATFA